MEIKNEKIEILKEGRQVGEHECNWVRKVNYDSPDNVTEHQRICRHCGRVERVTKTIEKLDFDELYSKFYEGE